MLLRAVHKLQGRRGNKTEKYVILVNIMRDKGGVGGRGSKAPWRKLLLEVPWVMMSQGAHARKNVHSEILLPSYCCFKIIPWSFQKNPFRTSICDFNSSQKGNLTKHIDSIHQLASTRNHSSIPRDKLLTQYTGYLISGCLF